MATVNIEIVDDDWTQLAADTDEKVLAQKSGSSDWYVALTDTNTKPTLDYPHLLRGNEQVSRLVFGDGYVWAKNEKGSAQVAVTK